MEGSRHMAGGQLPPGFRFHPTDEELIIHYLKKKIAAALPPASSIIAEVNLYRHSPWELPEMAFFGEGEWFFFTPRERKYPNGVRPNRAAGSGYWKATGTDKPILAAAGGQCIGVKKALAFYNGRPPKGTKTDWVMSEYRLLGNTIPPLPPKQRGFMRLDDWVLCRVRKKGGNRLPENNESSHMLFCKSNHHDEKLLLQQQQQQVLPAQVEKNNISLLNVYQQQGNSEEAESTVESSGGSRGGDSGSFGAQQLRGNGGEQKLLSSMLGPEKTKLPLGALDELMLLQPSKRLQYSLDESDSDDHDFMAFLA
ncbi:NAC transcription factor NAM-B1 [Platanthera guangdongensis]|uniref:NAC transcription factor NAM-B1 n=1 Tax=Platanthera guangdongensis TaxID=2320717 RepID=A0ABR2MN74_9ASPA